MTERSVPEWVGKSPDDWPPPTAVQRRIWRKQNGHCPLCTREMHPGNITLDHRRALVLGGENREANLQWICTEPCSREKSGDETSSKAKADRSLNARLGFKGKTKKARRPMPGSRASPWKRKLDGTWVRR